MLKFIGHVLLIALLAFAFIVSTVLPVLGFIIGILPFLYFLGRLIMWFEGNTFSGPDKEEY
jgi:hypothetical protein